MADRAQATEPAHAVRPAPARNIEPAPANARGRKLLWALPAAAAVLALDLATKWIASDALKTGGSVAVVGDLLRFTLVHNSGAAFGLFPGQGPAFLAFSIAAVVLIILLIWRLAGRARSELLVLGAVLGGALGNVHDRLRAGVVIDFIDIGLGPHRWPVFNVADMAVTLGVVALLLRVGRRPLAR